MSGGGDGSGSDETGDGGANGTDGAGVRLNRYFDALADERRRRVLYYLAQHGTASVRELARHLVGHETGRSPDSLDEDEYESVASELFHRHLPRLADYGLVEFDTRSKQVRFREQTRTFSTLLWLGQLVEGEREP